MGRRGPGAIKQAKPKQPAKPVGRPRTKIHPDVAELIRGLVPEAIKVLRELLQSENDLYRLRAAIAIVEHGGRPTEEPDEGGGEADRSLTVTYSNDWRKAE